MMFPNGQGSWCVIALESENHLLMMLPVEVEGNGRKTGEAFLLLDLESEGLRAGDSDVDKCIPSCH